MCVGIFNKGISGGVVMYEWTITHIFDDFLINDDLLAYTPKDWRYAIPQTIEEAKKLIVKTIVKESVQDKKQWIYDNQISVIVGIAEDNAQHNQNKIRRAGYEYDDLYGRHYRIECDPEAFTGSMAIPIEEYEYDEAINGLDLLPETAHDVVLGYSIYSIIERIADGAFSRRYLYEEQQEYQNYINNDKPIISEIDVFLLSALALAVMADKEKHGDNGYYCKKADLITQAMQCLMKAKDLITDNNLLDSATSIRKLITLEVTAEVRNAYADSIRQEVREKLEQEMQQEKAAHAKMMASARNAQHLAAKELLAQEWLIKYKNEQWNSAEAAAEALTPFMRSNGFSYSHRWFADAIRETAKANGIKFR